MEAAKSLARGRISAQATTDMPVWLKYLFVFTVFSKELGHVSLAGIDYDFIGYNFCIIYLIANLNKLYLNTRITIVLTCMLVAGLISNLYLGLEMPPLLKQFIPLTIIVVVNYDFFSKSRSYIELFSIYITISYFTAIFGLIQLAVKYFLGIKLLTDYSKIFIDSIAYEPSHYAALILPASVYAFMNFRNDKFRSTIILLAMFGTFSSTSYVVMMTAIFLIFINPVYLIFILPVLYYLYFNVFLSFENYSDRANSMTAYFETGNLMRVNSATSLSFLSNVEVAQYSLSKSPLIGAGLGGHETMYFRFFENSSYSLHPLFGLNAPSGHSLIIRVFSELGLLGGMAYLWFLIRNLILKSSGHYRIISIACFSHFLCKFLKLGGYIDYGTPFFVIMYLFNFNAYLKNKSA